MGLDGSEVSLFLTMSPALLAIRPLRRLVTRHFAVVQLASLIGLAAFAVTKREPRLKLMIVGVALQSLGHAAEWDSYRGHPDLVYRKGMCVVCGFAIVLRFGRLRSSCCAHLEVS